jgi:hypothetical protein
VGGVRVDLTMRDGVEGSLLPLGDGIFLSKADPSRATGKAPDEFLKGEEACIASIPGSEVNV